MNAERGQAAVEFVIFSVLLILGVLLIVQLSWIGVQKWQFNHFAAYSARVWSVQKDDDDPEDSLLKVQAVALVRWNLLSRDLVKAMWVQNGDDSHDYEPEHDGERHHVLGSRASSVDLPAADRRDTV